MISWDDLRFLLSVHRHHTMTAAARALGTNVATVSRRIDRLSGDLGMPPFLKRSEGWQLNPALGDLMAGIDEFDAHLERTLNNARMGTGGYTAAISIGCPQLVTRHILLPALAPEARPPRDVALSFNARPVAEGLADNDIVVRVGEPEGGRIIRRRAGALAFGLFGLRSPDDSGDWAGLTPDHDGMAAMQLALARFGRPPVLRVEQFDDLATAMRVTGLPGPLPEPMGRAHPDLAMLPDSGTAASDLWLFYHASRRGDRALHDAADWIVRAVRGYSARGVHAAP